VTELDTDKPVSRKGRNLMEAGMLVATETKPKAFVFVYKKK
jgi:hypothetical protein